jgi:hypothetical protein
LNARFFTLAFVVAVSAGAADHRDWNTGKVLDSQTAKTFVQTGASTQSHATANSNGSATANTFGGTTSATYSGTTTTNGVSETQVHTMIVQDNQLLIVGNEFLFLVNDSVEKGVGIGLHGSLSRAIANRKHGCRLIINDPVQYAQDKAALYVKDVDGKECKMDIVKQERLAQPAATSKP